MGAWRLAAAFILAPATAAACPVLPEADGHSRADRHSIAFRLEPSPPLLGQPFAVVAQVCGPDGPAAGPLEIDADMPEHRHGMNYRPEMLRIGDGRWRAEGLLFHMPGFWRLRFELGREQGPPVRIDVPMSAP